jgi:hypothetical protein
MQTWGKLKNDLHQKFSTYLQQFKLNIKYKKGSTNQFVDWLSRPLVSSSTIALNPYGHETSRWFQLYYSELEFPTTYQTLGASTPVTNFHLRDGSLCHLGHICVSLSEHAKLILEDHYSQVVGHFGMETVVAVLQNHFYWPKI